MKKLSVLLALFAALTFSASADDKGATTGTVPFIFDDNRIFAELNFVRPDGTLRKACAFVDLGTPAMVLDRKLRDELQIGQGKPLRFRAGDLEVVVESAAVETDTDMGVTGPDGKRTVPVEATLSGVALLNYEVVFDYRKRTLTIGRANALTKEGDAVPCRINTKTGLPSISVEIDGNRYSMAIDTGSGYSWIRSKIADNWVKAHPEWERGRGAVGEANMQMGTSGAEAKATLMRVPEIKPEALRLREIGMAGIARAAPSIPPVPGENSIQGDFFDWYSRKASEPVIGWLGGNVLKGFRLTVDFPRRITYWQKIADLDQHDLDQVGITLEKREGAYFIAGIATRNGTSTVSGVEMGDRLLQIDKISTTDATRGAILTALHGKPGSSRTLLIERGGKRLTIVAKVTAF